MQLENMSREQLMDLARKHEQELAEARASMVAMPLVSDEELAQQGGGELPQDIWTLIDLYADAREELMRGNAIHLVRQLRENVEAAKADVAIAILCKCGNND